MQREMPWNAHRVSAVAALFVLGACQQSDSVEVASNCAETESCVKKEPQAVKRIDAVDILLVIDSSGSIAQEADALKAELPRMINAVVTGSDEDTVFPPASSVHVAVVTSDMGAAVVASNMGAPEDRGGCEGLGDDGTFLRPGEVGVTCEVDYPGYLAYEGGKAPLATVNTVSCVPLTDIYGCGFEHQLEAGLKALWPASNDDVEFRVGTGHGDGINAGFLRPDSLLVVVVVTDEDDCSAEDPGIFSSDPNDPVALQPINLRCALNPDALYPVERYVDGLKALRPNNDNVIFATIAGVPEHLLSDGASAAFASSEERQAFYETVLADPRMQQVVDIDNREAVMTGSENLIPSCESANAQAYPPRRLVETARGFGENGLLGSICADNYGGMTGAIIRAMSERMIAAAEGAGADAGTAGD